MKCKMSIQAKRKLLDSFAGRFYSIEWVNVNLNNLKHTLVNIPDPNNPDSRIVGVRIDENHEAWGERGLSEPLTWLSKQLDSNHKQDEFALYGYATPSGKLYTSSLEALQNCEQSWVKVYVINKEGLK